MYKTILNLDRKFDIIISQTIRVIICQTLFPQILVRVVYTMTVFVISAPQMKRLFREAVRELSWRSVDDDQRCVERRTCDPQASLISLRHAESKSRFCYYKDWSNAESFRANRYGKEFDMRTISQYNNPSLRPFHVDYHRKWPLQENTCFLNMKHRKRKRPK